VTQVFETIPWAAELADVQEHRVAGIVLPSADANHLFIMLLTLRWRSGEE
jgi:hypothetical protein